MRKKWWIFLWMIAILVGNIGIVHAQQLTIIKRMKYQTVPGPGGRAVEYISYVEHNHHPAICVEPNVSMHFGNDYALGGIPKGLETVFNKMNQFMYFAFEQGSGAGDINYAAAQMYAWSLTGYQPVIKKGPKTNAQVQQRIQEIIGKMRALNQSEIQLTDLTTGNVVAKGTSKKLSFHQAVLGHRYQLTRTIPGFSIKRKVGSLAGEIQGNSFVFTASSSMVQQPQSIHLFSQSNPGKSYSLYGKNLQKLFVYNHEEIADFELEIQAKDFSLQLMKEDKDTKRPQGDVPNFDRAVYQLLNSNREEVGKFYFKQGISNVMTHLIPDQLYYLQEIQAPVGMRLDPKVREIRVSGFEASNLKEGIKKMTVGDEVFVGTLSIQKYIANSEDSDYLKPEEKAEFTAILQKYVQQFGGFEQALAHVNTMSPKEYSVFQTNADGLATSSQLAYGKYVVKQTKASHPEIALFDREIPYEVKKDHQHQTITLSNIQKEYYLRIAKIDATSKRRIQRQGTKFKLTRIQDEQGNPVWEEIGQRVGPIHYSIFETNSKDPVVQPSVWRNLKDDYGILSFPLPLKPGKYRLEELVAPKGFKKWDIQEFELGSFQELQKDNGVPYVLIPIENQQKSAILELKKVWKNWAGSKDVSEKNFQKVEFELRAKKDIENPIDGSIVIQKGELAKNVEGKEVGRFSLNSQGLARIEGLYLGEYELRETKVPKGVIAKRDPISISFLETESLVLNKRITLENEFSKVEVSKLSLGGQEVEGAHLVVTNEDHQVVDEWDSSKSVHKIQGLELGKSYYLEETLAPIGYSFAQIIKFQVKEDGSVSRIKMVDKPLEFKIKKVDEFGHPVKGAKLELLDESKNKLATWTSDGQDWDISSYLQATKSYWIKEVEAPHGYRMQEDLWFEVSKESKKLDLFFMNEAEEFLLKIEKSDRERSSKKLSEATYRVFYSNGEEVKNDQNQPLDLKTNEEGLASIRVPYHPEGFYLKEIEAPEGYEISKNVIPISLKEHQPVVSQSVFVPVQDKKKKSIVTGDFGIQGFCVLFSGSVFVLLYLFWKNFLNSIDR